MRTGRAAWVLATALLVTGLRAAPADAAVLKPTFVSCNQTITKSIRVANNLDCPGNGLIIGKDGITIDLGGHHIHGDAGAGEYGIEAVNRSRVVVRNGVLSRFHTGVRMVGVSQSRVSNLVVFDVTDEAVMFLTGSRNTVSGSILWDADDGVYLTSGRSTISRNTIFATGGRAIDVPADGTLITRNTILDNTAGILSNGNNQVISRNILKGNGGDGAMKLLATDDSVVSRNTVVGNEQNGIYIAGGTQRTVISKNRVTGNGASGIYVNGDANTVTRNVANANDEHGIHIDMGVANDVLLNRADENGVTGITSTTSSSDIRKNKVNYNGYFNGVASTGGFGIKTPMATITSGNTATQNGANDECDPVGACTTVPAFLTGAVGTISCGENVGSSYRPINNIDNCDQGIEITGNGVTMDFAGHRLEGTGDNGEFGIDNDAQHDDLAVSNAVIIGFDEGFHALGAERNHVSNLTIGNSTDAGIDFGGASGDAVISGSTVFRSGADGIDVNASNGHDILRNLVITSGTTGIDVFSFGVGGALVSRNRSLGNAGSGLAVGNSSNVVLSRNVSVANAFSGITVEDSTETSTLSSNVARGNLQNGIGLDSSPNNRLLRNTAVGNLINGIGQDSSTGNVYVRNKASANTGDGIFSATGSVTISRNVANENGHGDPDADDDKGIQAQAGATGSKNTAKRNDSPQQCDPASLC